ncbi:MAG: transposase, partial [Thermodesulfobacteriota bacterium]
IVVAQVRVADKTNEIPMVKPLLAPLPIKGAVVTADALHAQVKTAKYIVEKKKADYVFIFKDNQPTRRDDIRDLHLEAFPPDAPDDGQGPRPPGDPRDPHQR